MYSLNYVANRHTALRTCAYGEVVTDLGPQAFHRYKRASFLCMRLLKRAGKIGCAYVQLKYKVKLNLWCIYVRYLNPEI